MLAEERTRKVIHREWTLRAPAHYTDVQAALAFINNVRGELAEKGLVRTSDPTVHAEDELIVIGFSYEQRA